MITIVTDDTIEVNELDGVSSDMVAMVPVVLGAVDTTGEVMGTGVGMMGITEVAVCVMVSTID